MVSNEKCIYYESCLRESLTIDGTVEFICRCADIPYKGVGALDCETCNKSVELDSTLSMSIDIPKTISQEEYLDSIDINNELRLINNVIFFGSYENYKAVQKRTVEFISELANKLEN